MNYRLSFAKVAFTFWAERMVTLHVRCPVQAPDQCLNMEPRAAVASSRTRAP